MPMPLRCVYCDLDGTLLGRGASLFHDAEGEFSLLGARALEACARAGAEVVLYSGRRMSTLFHDARTLGVRCYAFESGAGLVLDGELHWLTGGLVPRDGRSIFEQIADSGGPALLLERFAGRLEYHDPWHVDREVSHLFRGEVDAFEADAVLQGAGLGHLRLVDNGGIHLGEGTVGGIERPRAYHLIPAAASKANAVAFHMRARGYARQDCVAVGDSREDMGAAESVATFWLVANAIDRDPTIRETLAGVPNARLAGGRNGAGVYEAVMTELAERR
jgi:3-deoxy-D-manno-octulosonate 8-phosphate phosphatase KdsC-like HAD superfamily phosphatase